MLVASAGFAQTASTITVQDTRNTNPLPATFQRIVRYDFKIRDSIGSPGSGYFAGLMTFAPWGDATGGKVYQMNYNNSGIYYRGGSMNASSWEAWKKLVTEDENGNISLVNKFGLNLYDKFTYSGKEQPHYGFQWLGDPDYAGGNSFWISSYGGFKFFTYGSPRFVISASGNVGIGTTTPKEKLSVNGKIRAQEIKVENTNWPDYVFAHGYQLPSLMETENHIKEKGRLPGIPSATEVKNNGIDLGEMNAKLLQKIEELTLYLIEIKKENEELKLLKNEMAQLKALVKAQSKSE